MIEKLSECAKVELDKGIEKIDTEEMSKVAEIIKELAEAEYYASVTKAMEEHDFDDEEDIMDEGRRGYRGQPRSQSGRYMSRGDGRRSNRGRGSRRGYESSMMEYDDMDYEDMQYMRDMDRPYGRMGYSGSGSSGGSSMGGSQSGQSGNSSMNSGQMGYSESRYDRARRGYEEAKSMHKDNSSEGKQMKMKSLEDYMKELSSDVSSMITDMTPEEKSLMRTKLQTLAQKVS